jgi:hypothetical protein
MSTAQLTTLVSLILALSIASERLVEIVKGLVPWLNTEKPDPNDEGRRGAALQFLAILAGIATAFLARGAIPVGILPAEATGPLPILALGLLASGGSGFWNSILGYVGKVKDVKTIDAQIKQATLEAMPGFRK